MEDKTDRSCFAICRLSKVLFLSSILLALSRFANKIDTFARRFDNRRFTVPRVKRKTLKKVGLGARQNRPHFIVSAELTKMVSAMPGLIIWSINRAITGNYRAIFCPSFPLARNYFGGIWVL
jgi:hypothetical protein